MAEDAPPERTTRAPPPKPSLQRTLIYTMVFLTAIVLLTPDLRLALGSAMGLVFGPAIGFNGDFPLLTLLLAGSFTTIVSSTARHLSTDWVKMARVNKKMQALQKARIEALRRGNPKKVEKLQELVVDLRAESAEVQMQQMKPLAFTFLPFIVFWAWLSSWLATDVIGQGRVFVAVPWSFQASLAATYLFPAWFLLYFVFTGLLGTVFTRILKFVSFRSRLAALEAQGGAG